MIYVDALFATPISPRWRYRQACHMTADSLAELHHFAGQLGLRREWFQPRPPHYDLTATTRGRAVRLGAQPVPRREMLRRSKLLAEGT